MARHVQHNTLNYFFTAKTNKHQVLRSSVEFARAHADKKTKHITVYYNALAFHNKLEERVARIDNKARRKEHSSGSTLCAICRCSLAEPYIKCAECLDILVCLQCFSKGREVVGHRNSHAYIIVRDDVQVFATDSSWTARDERILLQALHTHGYGNWDDIAKSLQRRHSAEEIRRHYHDCYFGGIFERLLGLQHVRNCYMPERMPYVFKMRSLEPPRHDDIASIQFKINAGYRCARGDFDTPYDSSAEGLLSVMVEQQRADDDDELETGSPESQLVEELQCALVRAYNNRLR